MNQGRTFGKGVKGKAEATGGAEQELIKTTCMIVNGATNSDYTPEQVNADPKLLARITAPTKEQVREEAAQLEANLTKAGATPEIARAEAERYIELRLKENKTEEDYTRLAKIAATAHLGSNLEGTSAEQFSPAMNFCHQWEEKAEGLTGKRQEHAIQMADMFRALATTQMVEPAALEEILKKRGITEDQKTQIKAMFLPNLESVNALAREEVPKPEIHSRIDAERDEARRIVFLQPKLATLLKVANLDENAIKQFQKANELQAKVTDRYSERGDFETVEKQNGLAREHGNNPALFAQKTYELANESGYFTIGELNSLAAMVSLVSSVGIGEAETSIGAQAAAAQAQMMKDILELAREEGERAEEAKKLIDELRKQESKAGTVGELETELAKKLEEMGISKDATIEEAVEFMNNIIAQNTAVAKLRKRGEEGLVPSFEPNPVGVLESGLMNSGEFTEEGIKALPALLAESAADIQISIGQVNIGELSTEAQLEILGNVEVVQAYMLDPKNEEKQKAAIEILQDPKFVAIRAAFLDALSQNVSRVVPAALPGFE